MIQLPSQFIRRFLALLFLIIICSYPISALSMDTLFYSSRGSIAETLHQHHQKINAIITQAYYTNSQGQITGHINPETIRLAHQYRIALIAQVTNHLFDSRLVHDFLKDEHLQEIAIQGLVAACRENQLTGIQIDFEHMGIEDSPRFAHFVEMLATALHRAHLTLYVAVIPPLSLLEHSTYTDIRDKNWSGVYDLASLSKSADFIDLMTYDQHVDHSTPGPIAGDSWMKAVVINALKSVPKEKLLFGIPTYSGYWQMKRLTPCEDKTLLVVGSTQINYQTVTTLMNRYHPMVYWDEKDKVHFALFAPDFIYRYLFIEDTDSFSAKLGLAKGFDLHGIAVFRLGTEDPKIWDVLPSHP